MLDERSVQKVSTPFNIFKNKGNIMEAMLNESLTKFKFDSTHFQQLSTFFTLSTMSERPV